MDVPSTYLDRIHAILPTLVITSMHFNQDGMVNDVVMVNDQFIARFPKDAHAKERLATESRILELVGVRVEMPVPQFEYQAQDVVIYRMLAGEPLTREMLLSQDEAMQDRLAEQLALFLSQLHAIPRELVGHARRYPAGTLPILVGSPEKLGPTALCSCALRADQPSLRTRPDSR